MGLDQFAYSTKEQNVINDENFKGAKSAHAFFQWCKNYPLQNWMQKFWFDKTGKTSVYEFNCSPIRLREEDIEHLRADIESGKLAENYSEKDYTREMKERDLWFCDTALEKIGEGRAIYYVPWW